MTVSLKKGKTPNYTIVEMGDLKVHFSYETPIAFSAPSGTVARMNDWGPTTGKHLNAVDGGDKAGRVSGDEFEARLAGRLAKMGL